MCMSSSSGGCKQHNSTAGKAAGPRRSLYPSAFFPGREAAWGGAQCICQARQLQNLKATIRNRTAGLADRKRKLAEDIAAADAKDQEPRCYGNGQQR